MRFEVGKYYKHSNGMIHIIGGLQTTQYGGCLVAEEAGSANLRPIGQSENNAQNWEECTKEDWMQNFSQ